MKIAREIQRILDVLVRRASVERLASSPSLGRALQYAYFSYKALESRRVREFISTVRPGSTAIDVGAHWGYVTRLLLAKVGPTGRVIAVEPLSKEFPALQSLVSDARLEIVTAVCGPSNGQTNFIRSGALSTDSHVGAPGQVSQMATIDHIVSLHRARDVSLIKIDVQGGEIGVLEGAAKTVKNAQPALVLELDPMALARGGSSLGELLDRLADMRYAPYYQVRPTTFARQSLEQLAAELAIHRYLDVLFLPTKYHGP